MSDTTIPAGKDMVKLSLVKQHIHRALGSIYNDHSRGRITWLTRVGPDGRRTRDAWVILPSLRVWANSEGVGLGRPLREMGEGEEATR